MALEVEGVVDGGVDVEKPLRGAGRFEALHPSAPAVAQPGASFSAAIVHPQPLLVTAGQAKNLKRGGIRAQLVADRQLRRKAPLLAQFAHQPHGRPFIPARLDQQIEDFALLVDGTPQDMRPSAIRMTISSRCHWSPGRAAAAAGVARLRDEFYHPAANRFTEQVELAFGILPRQLCSYVAIIPAQKARSAETHHHLLVPWMDGS